MSNKWQSYDVYFLRYVAWQTEFFVILDCFLHFYPPNNPTKQNFKKMKKKPMDISSFYNSVPKLMIICCTIPEIQCVMDVIIFNFGSFFAFLPPNSQKYQNEKKNLKKHLKISSFYIFVPKIMIRWYMVPEIWCVTDRRTEKVTYRGGCPT